MQQSRAHGQPHWWNDKHDSTWERVRAALRRDWEQTKADFSKKGHDLNQDVDDTVMQAAGKQPIPPSFVATDVEDWTSVEAGMRYGVGARQQYAEHNEWTDDLEKQLRADWGDAHDKDDSSWDKVKTYVRHGWESVKRTVS